MHDTLKELFDQVHAEEALKEETRTFLAQKTRGYTRAKMASGRRMLAAAVCLLLLLIGGYWLYFVPTAEISIDINPSIELGINRFDKVVSVRGYNDDGDSLADTLDVKYAEYTQAVEQILTSEEIASLLSGDEVLTIAVIGPSGAQASRILSDVVSCAAGHQNAYCYFAREEEVAAAHEAGLSYGKYRAFLILHALDPSITVQDVQDMTMRELWGLVGGFSMGETGEASQGEGTGHHRYGQENGHGAAN